MNSTGKQHLSAARQNLQEASGLITHAIQGGQPGTTDQKLLTRISKGVALQVLRLDSRLRETSPSAPRSMVTNPFLRWIASLNTVKKQLGTAVPWLRRHSGIITILGPFIVFGTFIFKEVLREGQKDLVDDIKSEESAAAVQNNIHSLYQLVWDNYYTNIENALENEEWNALENWPKVPLPRELFKHSVDAWRALWKASSANNHDISKSLKLASELSSKLHASSDSEVLSQLQNLLNQNSERVRRCAGLLGGIVFARITGEPTWMLPVEIGQLHSEQIYLVDRIEDVTHKLLEKEHSALHKSENNYRTFTNVSYGLYTLGFLVTVCGQLLGIKAPSEG
jgi:hypothetical protein